MTEVDLDSPIRITLFAQPPDGGRRRRPTDVVLIVVSLVVVGWTWVRAVPPSSFDSGLSNVISGLPSWFDSLWHVLLGLVTLWAVFLVAAAMVRRQWSLAVDAFVALALVVGTVAIVARLATGAWPDLWAGLVATGDPADFPSVRLATITAVVSTTSPHLVLPARRFGRALIAGGALAAVGLGIALVGGAAASVALGVAAACVIHLVRGSPGGELTDSQIAAALQDLGVVADDFRPLNHSTFGAQDMAATDSDGSPLVVRAYGRDAWDGQLLVSMWRSIAYRNSDARVPSGRLGLVEHQAFVSMRADRSGVEVPEVVAAGATTEGDAFLVTDGSAVSIRSAPEGSLDERFLHSLWSNLTALHRAHITHGTIDTRSVAYSDRSTAVLTDFSAASVAPSRHQVLMDRAQALALGALAVTPQASLDAAISAVGADEVAESISYLQPQALPTELRRQVKESDVDLADLRSDAATATGATETDLVKIRRASIGTVVQSVLILFAAWIIISAVANIGLDTLIEEFSNADWTWVVAAIVIAQGAPPSLAIATLGATVHHLKLIPVVTMQYAITFVNLVVPSTAARVATKVRFFQKVGLSVPEALSISALDSVAGFIIQLIVLIVIPLSGLATLGMRSDINLSGDTQLIVGVVAAIVVLLIVTFSVPKLRSMVLPPLKDAATSLRVLRSWKNVTQLFGGNIAYQLIQAVTLGCCLLAFGGSASLAQLVLINTGVSLIAGFMPIPGGMGVSEAAIVAGLSAIGIENSVAVSTAIAYRLATFYLPPIWGYPNLAWLRRNDYL